jgi:hypothetical protein
MGVLIDGAFMFTLNFAEEQDEFGLEFTSKSLYGL